ncbi:hypothetical protein E2C01_095873 [Portunus trituberculatus]|uniref:Uncharacterized protein n=1 Tax=Portunus trituberculatus TaxID=210409 RepID=A0A5B7K6T4_PORTR|nr:hypothetical protein [Portunus trituberculatus]
MCLAMHLVSKKFSAQKKVNTDYNFYKTKETLRRSAASQRRRLYLPSRRPSNHGTRQPGGETNT